MRYQRAPILILERPSLVSKVVNTRSVQEEGSESSQKEAAENVQEDATKRKAVEMEALLC